jgi:hypothetical protein
MQTFDGGDRMQQYSSWDIRVRSLEGYREMRIYRRCLLLLLTSLCVLTAFAPAVAADGPGENAPQACETAACSQHDNRSGFADDRRTSQQCEVETYRVLADADVTMGAIVGGPESGFPVALIGAPGTAFTSNTTIQAPSGFTPFVLATADGTPVGATSAIASGPLMLFVVSQQSLHANDLFTADRDGTILVSSPGIVTLSGCE